MASRILIRLTNLKDGILLKKKNYLLYYIDTNSYIISDNLICQGEKLLR